MRWATRAGIHVDRTACAWLILRFIDPEAKFVFVHDPDEVPADATPFDMRGARSPTAAAGARSRPMLAHYQLDDAALADIARIVHEADLDDERFDAPEARGLDVIIRGLSLLAESDEELLQLSGPIYDGLYEYRRRATLLGREPG